VLRRFALLFLSTLIAVSFVRVPSFSDWLSGSWFTLFRTSSALATISPPPPVLPSSLTDPLLPSLSPSPAPSSESHLPVDVRYHFYPIAGTTAAELRSQMLQRSPVSDAEGRSFDALTNWNVHWNIRFARNGKSCVARSINTQVDVVFTLPRWKGSHYVSSGLRTEWNHYMTALQLHEEGHKKNGVAAAQSVLQVLRQLPEYPNCRELEKAAKEAADQVIAVYNRQDIAYDRATGHGRTQGAVFPLIHADAQTAPNASL